MKTILAGVTGSIAYGLNTETSDEDIRGIFVSRTEDVLSIYGVPDVIDKKNPDVTYYEVLKFIRLALKANPSILELLYLEKYIKQTSEGKLLVDNRDAFLSKTVFKSYGGYAISQIRMLNRRGYFPDKKNRYAKHARHCFRLLQQGRELLTTGTMDVKVKNRDELFALGEMSIPDLVTRFEEEFKKFDAIVSILPDTPDVKRVNDILLTIRKHND